MNIIKKQDTLFQDKIYARKKIIEYLLSKTTRLRLFCWVDVGEKHLYLEVSFQYQN